MSRIHLAVSACLAVLCGSLAWTQSPDELTSYPVAQAPAELRPAVQRADLIIVSLQNTALAELTRELDRHGPAGATKACHLDLTAQAYQSAREPGVAAGRTSDRLRNPRNAPRPWAAPIVARYAGQQASRVDGFVVDLGDRVGVMRPIAHLAMCEPCHGSEDHLDRQVVTELKNRYPTDRGIGFEKGEIRGWYWVEVPKP